MSGNERWPFLLVHKKGQNEATRTDHSLNWRVTESLSHSRMSAGLVEMMQTSWVKYTVV